MKFVFWFIVGTLCSAYLIPAMSAAGILGISVGVIASGISYVPALKAAHIL